MQNAENVVNTNAFWTRDAQNTANTNVFEGKAKNNVVFYPLSGTKTVVFTWVLAI